MESQESNQKTSSSSQKTKRSQNFSNQKNSHKLVRKISSSLSDSSQNESMEQNQRRHKLWKQSLLLDNPYIKKFIKKSSKYTFKCEKCSADILKRTGKEEMFCENLYPHILSDTHLNNTPKSEEKHLNELINLIESKQKQKVNSKKLFKKEDESSDFLKFIAFTVAERFSYSQISRLGRFLQHMAQQDQLKFLNTHSFDAELISKTVSECFRPALLDEIYEDLANSKFSFSIDNATMVGESLCAMRVKYLKEDQEKKEDQVQNVIIGIAPLKDRSDAEAIYSIVKEKIFHSKISKENFVGLTHDNADYLASENNGLVGLIRKDFEKYFLDLPDPCHCLNLAVKSSLQELPSNVMDFIEQIHHFFAFPQRKAKLKMIQEEKGRRILLLKKYVGTRWLSLGQSLERLIIIWESLEDYMDFSLIKGKVAKKVKEKLKFFKECLKDPIFKCEILLLNFILNKVNALYVKLQDQNFKISSLKTEMKLCFESIFELVCEAEKFHETPFSELLKIEWGSSQVREEWFLKEKDFIKKLSFKIHGNFETLTNLETDKKTKWISNYQNYISQLLAKFIKKMPFENEMLGIVDFLELKDKYVTLEQKLAKFNDMFQVVEKEELRNEVFSQLLRLRYWI